MKKFVYTFMLLASIQFMYGQRVIEKSNDLNIAPKFIAKSNDLNIAPKVFEKTHKANFSQLAPLGIMVGECDENNPTYYSGYDSITPTNDTLWYILSSTELFSNLVSIFSYLEASEITGTIDTVEIACFANKGSLVGNCRVLILENDGTNNYAQIAASDSINLASMEYGNYYKFGFSNPVTFTKNLIILFYVNSSDTEDAVALFTTEICTTSSFYTLWSDSKFHSLSEFISGYYVEPIIYLNGTFTIPDPEQPVITTTSLPNGKVGTAYSATLTATGGSITWSIESGTLPAGLTLSPSTGQITGTPTTVNTYSFTVKATNSAGSVTKLLTITIGPSGGSSIAESQANAINIYPNPTQGTLNITSEEAVEQVTIFDISGRNLLQIANPNQTIDINSLANGIYIVKVKTEQGETVRKIVKE